MSDTKEPVKAKGAPKDAPSPQELREEPLADKASERKAPNVAVLAALDEIHALAGQVQLYAEHDRAGMLTRKLRELVDQAKAAL